MFYLCNYRCKEHYKKQGRQGIRMGWKRGGRSAHTIALNGTRHPKLPHPDDDYYAV